MSSHIEALLESETARYKRAADRNHAAYVASKVAVIVLSAALPAFTSNDYATTATVLAVLVAAVTALEAHFKWGEMWRHFRSLQLALGKLNRRYGRLDPSFKESEAGQAELASILAGIDAIIDQDADLFWSLRFKDKEEKPDGELAPAVK